MSALIQHLSSISAGVALGWMVAIITTAAAGYTWIQKYRKMKNKYEDTQTQTEQNTKALSQLKEQTHQLEDFFMQEVNRLDQNDISINNQLTEIGDKLEKIDKYNKAKDMNVLKDRIYRNFKSYRLRAKYNKGVVFITKNQLEAFEGLIDSYTAAEGNSFIHKEIRPAVMEWEVLSEEEVASKLGEK